MEPTPDDFISSAEDKEAYQSLMGALNWLSVMTRPDITYALSTLSRSLSNPTADHMKAAKRVLRYLAGTKTHGVKFGPHPATQDALNGFTDSSFCDDKATLRSTGAYVFKLFNGPISWQSKLQKLVTTSSCEAEYVAACEAIKEALFLKAMLNAECWNYEVQLGTSLFRPPWWVSKPR